MIMINSRYNAAVSLPLKSKTLPKRELCVISHHSSLATMHAKASNLIAYFAFVPEKNVQKELNKIINESTRMMNIEQIKQNNGCKAFKCLS